VRKRSSRVMWWCQGTPCLLADDGQQVFVGVGCLRGRTGRQASDVPQPRWPRWIHGMAFDPRRFRRRGGRRSRPRPLPDVI